MKKWKVKAIVTTLYYIGVYYPMRRNIYVRAFTENGARCKALRKLKKRYNPKEIKIIRVRPMSLEEKR